MAIIGGRSFIGGLSIGYGGGLWVGYGWVIDWLWVGYGWVIGEQFVISTG